MEYTHEGLIKYICEKTIGIGAKTADRIAGFMEDIPNFYQNTHLLSNFVSAKGKGFVKDSQIKEIKKLIDEYIQNPEIEIKKIWISVLIKDFVKNSINELINTSLEQLLINPFLVKAFGFDDHKEVISFYFYQKITRSVVTSWGFTVEGLLLCSGAEKTDMSGFDMKVDRRNKTYQLQIKSSPNTMSIEQVRQLNTHIKNIEDKINNIPILGMTYGTREQINSQIQSTLIDYPKSAMIGKKLWDFISNEKGYCVKLIDLIGDITKNSHFKFSKELETKRLLLIEEWENNFGKGKKSVDLVLQKYL
jgi:hypothetical protein